MGCFRACFGHVRNTKKVQHQCLSPSNESVTLIPENTESLKEEEIVNPTKLISHLTEDIKLVENEKEKEDSLKKEYLPKESSSSSLQQESCCSSLFTLSIDSSRQFFAAEKEVTSLLNTSSKHEDEDYMTHECSFDKSKSGRGRKDNEIEVESLSSWLLETEKSPQKNTK